MSPTTASASRAQFAGIFSMAFAIVAYQVLLTRIFSVTLYYHFAFAGITLAMLGLTIGAERVFLGPERFAPDRLAGEWARAAMGFSAYSSGLLLFFYILPVLMPHGAAMVLPWAMLLFLIPFTYGGICVTLLLTRFPAVGRLYAADLAGAAAGSILIVWLLFAFDPVAIAFLLSALTAGAARVMAPPDEPSLSRKAGITALVFAFAALLQGGLYITDSPHIGLVWAKGEWQRNIVFERWNAFSRVRVTGTDEDKPFGWAYGHPQTVKVSEHRLDIDSQAATVITHYEGDKSKLAYLANDVINMAYHIRPVESVAIVGMGGGRDILSALYFGASHILALEFDPAIVEAVTVRFADYAGHLEKLPGVTIVNDEARSWLAAHRPEVDLVQISLIDTWAATAAGGLTLSENRLYTVEAWQGFFGVLKPHGMLSVSRWYHAEDYPFEFHRLLSLAAAALERSGVPAARMRRHILAFSAGDIATVLVNPAGFTDGEIKQALGAAQAEGFKVLLSPDYAVDEVSRTIASGEATPGFYAQLHTDISAPTDNRPFFFFMMRAKDALYKGLSVSYNAASNGAVSITIMLLFATMLITGCFVIWPLWRQKDRLQGKHVTKDLLYFSAIGLGFMLIEISQMQRLVIFLGHPVYGLSVVLFTLLLSGGLGSATVHPDARPERLWKRPLLLCLVLYAVGLLTPQISVAFAASGTAARVFVSIALLAPAGFLMGMMFPIGMLLSAANREFQPWFWGINGAVSVFASILTVAISLEYGIAAAYWTGLAAYAACLLLSFRRHAS